MHSKFTFSVFIYSTKRIQKVQCTKALRCRAWVESSCIWCWCCLREHAVSHLCCQWPKKLLNNINRCTICPYTETTSISHIYLNTHMKICTLFDLLKHLIYMYKSLIVQILLSKFHVYDRWHDCTSWRSYVIGQIILYNNELFINI